MHSCAYFLIINTKGLNYPVNSGKPSTLWAIRYKLSKGVKRPSGKLPTVPRWQTSQVAKRLVSKQLRRWNDQDWSKISRG